MSWSCLTQPIRLIGNLYDNVGVTYYGNLYDNVGVTYYGNLYDNAGVV